MLLLFLKNRRGAITIMLSFLLTAVLSMNSTLVEVARYRGIERLYKEIEENAAFSTLSQYDRDLFKNYGLLAMSSKVNKDTFIDYLKSNLNYNLSETNGVDTFLEISEEDIDFEKLYNLAQEEVFKMQINEFCAYRAPADFINNTFNIEEIIKELVKDLENSLPVLKMFSNVCKSAEKIFDTFINLSEYQDKCKELKEQWDEYSNCVDKYNTAVTARDEYKEAEHDESEDYEGTLENKNKDVKERAVELQNSIKATESALDSFYKGYKKFVESFDAMQAANVKSMLSAAKADIADISDEKTKKASENMLKSMEKAYKNSEDMCSNITSIMDDLKEDSVRKTVNNLEEQHSSLGKEGSVLEKVTYVEMLQGSIVWDTIRLVAGTIEQIIRITQEWAEAFAKLDDILKMMKIMTTACIFDPDYNYILSPSVVNELPGRQKNGNQMVNADNPYETTDEAMVNKQILETEEVASYIGFDTSILNTNDSEAENLLLQQAMERMRSAEEKFEEACESLKSSWIFPFILTALLNVVVTLIEYIDSLINLVNVFIYVAGSNILQQLLYSKFNPAIYATRMFSNRATDISSDKKLNGSSFPDYSRVSPVPMTKDCFEMANAEYALCGSEVEIYNQSQAFTMILIMRLLCNIPALLSNEAIMDVVEALFATFIGAIVAIIIMIIVVLAEAWLDMLFMIYADEDVYIIKMDGYLSLDEEGGVSKDFKEKVDKLLKSIEMDEKDKKGEKGEKKTIGDKLEEHAKSLLKWGYEDHLLLMMLLFVPSKTMYARCADLIEMQMKYEKAISGEEFKLSEMATYVRIESTLTYKPLLPIPIIPGINSNGLKIENVHYSGY